MTATMAAGGGDGARPAGAGPGGGTGWRARLVAAFLGAVLGMAAGHTVAWRSVQPMPDDRTAQEIAARFVPDQPGIVRRDGAALWQHEPAGWRGALLGYREVRAAEVRVSFPATVDSPHVQHDHVTAVGTALRRDGWQRVSVEVPYPALVAHHGGWEIRYGPVLGEPPADPDRPQQVLGAEVTIRADTPPAAVLGLLVGALFGGLAGFGLVIAGQRRAPGRRWPAVLFTIGAVLLAPGTLAALGLTYVYLVDDLPQEPLWYAYGLRLTRPPTILAAALLLAALVISLRSQPRAQVDAGGDA